MNFQIYTGRERRSVKREGDNLLMRRKWFVSAVVVIILCGLVAGLYRFPKSINVSYPAVEYRGNAAATASNTTLHIKGTLFRPLFRNPIFHGRITVDKYDFTQLPNYHMADILFDRKVRHGWGSILYIDGAKPTGTYFAMVWKKANFASIKLTLFEPVGLDVVQESTKDLQIIAPANDYVSARAIAGQYEE